MSDARVVVVGAGLGGLRTVEGLRAKGFAGEITLVGAEVHAPYDRPPLTKQVLRGESDSTALRDELDSLDVTVHLGRRATGLDPVARTVTTDDGGELCYDTAVLAPGAVPRMLPGVAARPGLHVVRTIDDALALRASIAVSGAVTIVGGGFIGCEVAASARSTGASVDLVEILAAPLVRVLGPAGAELVNALHTEHGVRVHTRVGVDEVLGDEHVTGVRLTDGRVLDAPHAVVGLGVLPDIAWLDGSGLEIGDGITCDAAGRTSAPDAYAVGDAAQWYHPLAGGHRRVEHWTSTVEQARVVATNIADGARVELDAVPYFWSDQYDVRIQALGFVDAADDVELLRPGGRAVLLYTREGRVRAVVGFAAARWVMRLRPLIAAGAPVAEAAALLG